MVTLAEYETAIRSTGRKVKFSGSTLVAQCLWHDERNPSMQVFEDGWTACYAGCPRRHIGQAFSEFNDFNGGHSAASIRRPKIEQQRTYQTVDLMETWARLPLIPRSHVFKNLPLEVLDDLGWRWDESKAGGSYFIPYFDASKKTIPFAQWRHLTGERRFTFLANAKPRLYGKWNVSAGARLFLVEGASDAAVLEHCKIPWVALPSASSGSILTNFIEATKSLGLSLIYAGDNDTAGDTLKSTLDLSGVAYRVCQPPAGFKDWGDLYAAGGVVSVAERCWPKLFE